MPLKLFENDRTNKIVLYIILIALVTTSAILVSLLVIYLVSLEETGGGWPSTCSIYINLVLRTILWKEWLLRENFSRKMTCPARVHKK